MNWPAASTKQAADVITMRAAISVLRAVAGGRWAAAGVGGMQPHQQGASQWGGQAAPPRPYTRSLPFLHSTNPPTPPAHPPQKPRPESATKRTTVGHCPTAVLLPPMMAGCTTAPPPWLPAPLLLLELCVLLVPPPARLVGWAGEGRGEARMNVNGRQILRYSKCRRWCCNRHPAAVPELTFPQLTRRCGPPPGLPPAGAAARAKHVASSCV